MDVTSIADARAGLSGLIARFRSEPEAAPVLIGAHRRPEAVLLSRDAYERLTTQSGAQGVTLEQLRALTPLIDRLAAASNLSDVRVYGSVARGEQRDGSDVDLLVTPQSGASLFDIAQFELDMEMLLGVPVSAVPDTALHEQLDQHMKSEAVSL